MAGFGSTVVDFGSFPGASEDTTVITGQTGIQATSMIGAWLRCTGSTTDHSADEHIIENLKITAGNIVPGTGFTIYAETTDGEFLYGQYNVDWTWY